MCFRHDLSTHEANFLHQVSSRCRFNRRQGKRRCNCSSGASITGLCSPETRIHEFFREKKSLKSARAAFFTSLGTRLVSKTCHRFLRESDVETFLQHIFIYIWGGGGQGAENSIVSIQKIRKKLRKKNSVDEIPYP